MVDINCSCVRLKESFVTSCRKGFFTTYLPVLTKRKNLYLQNNTKMNNLHIYNITNAVVYTGWGQNHATHLAPKHVGRNWGGIGWMRGMLVLYPLTLYCLFLFVLLTDIWHYYKVFGIGFYPWAWKTIQNWQDCYSERCCSNGDTATKWSQET